METKLNKKDFLETINHPAKRQLAEMLIDGVDVDESQYGKTRIAEMKTYIDNNFLNVPVDEVPKKKRKLVDFCISCNPLKLKN